MKAKTLLTGLGLLSLLWCARGASQTNAMPWWASGMGYELSASPSTIVRSLMGQAFTGTMQGATSRVEAGFLVDTLFRTAVTSVPGPPELPKEYALFQNYPNPFNPSTTIGYALPVRSYATLAVFNTLGQQVVTLVNGEIEAGTHGVQFNAASLASGVYFYRLQAGSYVQTRRLLLVR